MLSRIGRSSVRARASASSPHGYQSTGLSACCSRYGLVSQLRRLVTTSPPAPLRRREVRSDIPSKQRTADQLESVRDGPAFDRFAPLGKVELQGLGLDTVVQPDVHLADRPVTLWRRPRNS